MPNRHSIPLLLVWLAVLLAAMSEGAQQAGPTNATAVEGLLLPAPPGAAQCGQEGMPVCDDVCFIKEMGHPEWCPAPLTEEGCRVGLTRIAITPTAPREDVMQDVCMALPQAGVDCGTAGKPCCIDPSAQDPSTRVRPQCQDSSLSCILSDPVTSLPYGSTHHMEAVLRYPRSHGLRATQLMGTCRAAAPVHESDAASSNPAAAPAASSSWAVNSVLGECGTGKLRCPRGTYCASNEDHLLGGARCVPMPVCGGPHQPCCPPFADGEPAVFSIVDKRTAVPTCRDPGAVCVWKSALPEFDPSKNTEAVQLLSPPPGSTSINAQFPSTLCLPNLDKCGQAGQPCCPHAQFASSNSAAYFRLHVCDHGLRCNNTISLFQQAGRQQKPVVLGVCEGVAEQSCGRLGQKCCTHTDQAGWTWRVCGSGQPGMFCGASNVCVRCPSTTTTEAGMSLQAAFAALALPGVGNTC